MLKKLIKHEFKATYRFYVPVYIALAALVALACIFLTVIDHFDVNELFLSITSFLRFFPHTFSYVCDFTVPRRRVKAT